MSNPGIARSNGVTLLASLVETSERVGAASSRLTKVRELAHLLRSLEPVEVSIGVLYLSGEVPQGRCGIGPSALRAAAGALPAATPSLSLAEVDRHIAEIAALCGKGVATRRTEALQQLFARATAAERSFLARLLLGELRQGALAGVMTDAIAAAAGVGVGEVRRAMMYAPHIGAVAQAALHDAAGGFAQFQLETLSPIAPMLAQTAADPADALRQLGAVDIAWEWKVDGARIQVHKSGSTVRIYTRNLNEVGASLPEIVQQVQSLPTAELILDGEAVAYDAADRPHPFQVTMRRFGRKLDVGQLQAQLPMRAFFFDCLRLEQQSLADRPARDRFEALDAVVPEQLRIPRLITASEPDAQAFYEAALAAGHEGVMAKALDSPYEAGNRGASWLKIKRAHTLDLVVLAAEWGHGRRTGTLSNLHLGALDPATGEYVMLGKTFKGLTDRMLASQTAELLAREVRRDDMTVYVRPELVVEIAFSDLQASPRYPGGLALRLARVKRYRDDKTADQADTMESVRRIFASQGAA
jgi:DNA ligase-1